MIFYLYIICCHIHCILHLLYGNVDKDIIKSGLQIKKIYQMLLKCLIDFLFKNAKNDMMMSLLTSILLSVN